MVQEQQERRLKSETRVRPSTAWRPSWRTSTWHHRSQEAFKNLKQGRMRSDLHFHKPSLGSRLVNGQEEAKEEEVPSWETMPRDDDANVGSHHLLAWAQAWPPCRAEEYLYSPQVRAHRGPSSTCHFLIFQVTEGHLNSTGAAATLLTQPFAPPSHRRLGSLKAPAKCPADLCTFLGIH